MKKIMILVAALLLLSGCSRSGEAANSGTASGESTSAPKASSAISNVFNTEIFDEEVATLDNITVNLNDVNDNIVNITNAGNYVLTGSFKGLVRVEVNNDAQVKLTLSNAVIENEGGPCIYFVNGDKLTVSAEADTDNYLTSKGAFQKIDDKKVDAVIFARDDLQVSGHGSLHIISEFGHGIVAKDDFVTKNVQADIVSGKKGIDVNDKATFKSGIYTIKSGSEGIEALEIVIEDGDITIDAGDDGINASNGSGRSMDPFVTQPGASVTISGGNITISAGGDGIDSNGDLFISGGVLTVTAFGPGMDSAIDYSGKCEITGGTQNVPEDYGKANMQDQGFGGFTGGHGGPGMPPPNGQMSENPDGRPENSGAPQGMGPGYHS